MNPGTAEVKRAVRRRVWLFVPCLYFMQGVPYVLVTGVSVVMFKKLGIPNGELALWTSFITLPWMLKMFWSPIIDGFSTKRSWILGAQVSILILVLILSRVVAGAHPWRVALVILCVLAMLSATHDIASDGFYLLALDKREQSFYVGITSIAYRVAMIFGTGLLVFLAGWLETRGLPVAETWSLSLLACAAFYGLLALLQLLSLPRPAADQPTRQGTLGYGVFRDYFRQPNIGLILGFILFYRFSESMITKMSAPFFIDEIARGGLGLSTQDVGFFGGVVGVGALAAGGILGGITLSRFGLKRCLWPLFWSMNVPNLLYFWAAITQPVNKAAIFAVVALDQFGYGFGFSAYFVFLMYVSRNSSARTSHYAISTGLMAFGALLAGAVSGYIQEWLGYPGFFAATLVLTIPGMLILRAMPLEEDEVA